MRNSSKLAIKWLETFELGVRSGLDLRQVVEWLALNDVNLESKKKAQVLALELNKESSQKVFERYRYCEVNLGMRILWEVCLMVSRGVPNSSKLLSETAKLLRKQMGLENSMKTLMFVPKLQILVAILVCSLFVFFIPWLSSGMIPSFVTQQRYDLFLCGFAILGVGIWFMIQISKWPNRKFGWMVPVIYFFRYLGLYLESGHDLASAWRKASNLVEIPETLKSAFERPNLSHETFEDFLKAGEAHEQAEIREIFMGIIWALRSAVPLSVYFEKLAEQSIIYFSENFEADTRKVSGLVLLPLGFLIMPASLFLLLGPQLMELVKL